MPHEHLLVWFGGYVLLSNTFYNFKFQTMYLLFLSWLKSWSMTNTSSSASPKVFEHAVNVTVVLLWPVFGIVHFLPCLLSPSIFSQWK